MAAPRYSRYYTYIKPVIENKTVRSTAPYVFSLIAVVIFAVFAIRPTVSTILNLQKDLENNSRELEALNTKIQNLNQGKQNLEGLGRETRLKINTSIPDQPNVTFLTKSLRDSYQNNSSSSAIQIQPLTLFNSNLPKQTNKYSLSEISFSYNTLAPYDQLLQILDNLNNSPRLLNLNSVTIAKTEAGTVLSVNGKAYYLNTGQ